MAGIAAVASLAGTAISAIGTIAAGKAQRKDAEFQAQQLDIRAKQEHAAAQREAEDVRRRKELVLSRQQVVSAASGMGADDPSVIEIAADTAGYGRYQEMSALAAGEARRKQNEYAAYSARTTGKAAQTASYYSAAGTIIGGIGNVFQQKYGNGGFAGTQPAYDYRYF